MENQFEQAMCKAKLKIYEAEKEFLSFYYNRISCIYSEGNDILKKNVRTKLELLIEDLATIDHNDPFDSLIAKKMRKVSSLSQAQLAKLLEMEQQTLSRYERIGGPRIKNRDKIKGSRYFKWLKEQGYNPYEI